MQMWLRNISSTFLIASIWISLCASLAFAGEDPTVINVLDYGAIPNDEIDDTDAIQRAIFASAPDRWQNSIGVDYFPSKTVVLPEGVFLVKTLEIYGGYRKIRGTGARSTILKQRDSSGPVIHLRGADYVTFSGIGIHGSENASYGVYADDIGYDPVVNGDLSAVHGFFEDVEIRDVLGSPGIGFANNGRAHSWEFNRTAAIHNNIGMKLVRAAQNTSIIRSSLVANKQQQLIIGDGNSIVRAISVRDTNIEGTNSGTTELVRLDGVDPITFSSCYFEAHRSKSAPDILTTNYPSSLTIIGAYSNGGASTKPEAAIKLATNTRLTIIGGTYINTSAVLSTIAPQGNPTWAKPELSRVSLLDVSGPGMRGILNLTQGGQTWDHGITVKQSVMSAQSWDILADRDGFFWFGRNRKPMAVISPEGSIRGSK